MKIAFLSFYSGQINRGAETVVYELASRFSKNNDVTVFQSAENNFKTNYKVKVCKVKINWDKKDVSVSLARRLFIDYWSLKIGAFTFKTIPTILKEKFDIVIPLNGGWQIALVRIATWLYGGKEIASGQSGKGWDDRNNLWSFPNLFVALTSNAEKWAKKVNPFVKVVKIPNGVDLQKFSSGGESYKTSLKKPIVLAVGAFTEQKRLDLTINAVSNLKDASLLLVGGGGELKEKLESEGKRLLGNKFQMLSIPFNEMPKIYKSADVFTLPSASSEAFGNVYVEAMASELPVVATDDEQRREIVGEAGILTDPTNIEGYSDALQKALNTDWGDKPRKQAEKFSWETIAKKYEELFKTLLNKN
jgi:glycosyltransferase involved in cell wall biosynthesis